MQKLLASTCAGLFVTSCFIDTDPDPVPVVVTPQGTLILDWTINGTKDPNQCAQGATTDLDVIVTTGPGDFAGEFTAPCEAFATSIPLAAGTYFASAVLLDAGGTERTTEVAIDAFTIFGNDSVSIPIDFPASSFRR